MKRILGIVMVLGFVGALAVAAQEVKPVKTEVIDLGNDVKLEMVLVPAGKFMMGSPASEKGRGNNETQHEVTLTKPFYMGKYEVTQEQWEAVMGKNPSSKTIGAKLPVTNVSWNDCQEFIKKLNAKTSRGYRLPTEAEWEFSCRAGTTTAFSFGDEIHRVDANYGGSKIGKPVAVGSYEPNAFGIYDMHGNVWEWCEDWYGDYPAGAVTDPKGPAKGKGIVLRGGHFEVVFDGSIARSASRNYFTGMPTDPDWYSGIGFRLARTADIKASAASLTGIKPDPAGGKPAPVKLELTKIAVAIEKEMVLVPAGKFKMGFPGQFSLEPQHEVTLTKPFYMGKYEVTQEQWGVVMGYNPSRTKGAKLPVTNVSWKDCQYFIKKLNANTKGGYRLPTEAEFEYACRAGTTTTYSFGDNLTESDANIDGKDTKAVGSYKPNAFGLYDMHGNVLEWCEDWYAAYPEGSVIDPKGPATGTSRILRGGSYFSHVSVARSSFRYSILPIEESYYYGFRLARTADSKASVASSTETKPDPKEVIPAGNLLVAPFTETKAKEVQKEVAKSLKKEVEEKEDLGKGIKLEMVLVPAGKFMMGDTKKELEELKEKLKEESRELSKKDLDKNALDFINKIISGLGIGFGRHNDKTSPLDFINKIISGQGRQHEVTITKPFYMGKYEVTQEQWEAVMGENPSHIKGAKLPVTNVSWEDCQEFIQKLNAKRDGGYRLPTEAEWECACRAGQTTGYSFGVNITPKDANYADSKIGKPVEVGSYKPNGFGLYEMHGNVWEWCEDWHGDYPFAATDPRGAADGIARVLRGGDFAIGESYARSSFRGGSTPSGRYGDCGFRLARTTDIKAGVAPNVPKSDPAEIIPATGNLLVAPFTEAKAKEVQKEVAKSLNKKVEEKTDLDEDVKLEMVLVPAGKFKMGSPATGKGRGNIETQHEVTITKPYYLGKYEVTQEQWGEVIGFNPSKTMGDKLPVTDVSWEDCQAFIKKLNAKTSGGYRLPTEAEWEFACRAGTTTAYSFGDSLTKSDANYYDLRIGRPIAVGSFKPNAFGLYDMHGNVWEWCEDRFADFPAGAATDPKGPATGISRVLRGGSFINDGSFARSSGRNVSMPSSSYGYFGFRLARTP